ncbi:MAG: amidase [Betaproteobacteria bacterium]|nr:amidase [Betaproteobacteria bacterium]
MGEIEFHIEDCLAQIGLQDRRVLAWQHIDREGALKRARELDQSTRRGPLYGMPMGIKDIIDVAGLPTGHGSRIYEGNTPQLDAACVTLARAAGAVILGKTVTTELATFVPSRTCNPQHLDHTPGGSSSGSAAAVAAGMVPLAIGTQTAGSIIRPAAYCGVTGYKPTYGLVPRGGVKLQSDSLDTVGVLARTVADAHRFFLAMTGAMEYKPLVPIERPLKINIVTNWMDQADVDMSVAIAEAAVDLGSAGCRVREIRLPPMFDEAQAAQRVVQMAENAQCYATERTQFNALLDPRLLAYLLECAAIDTKSHMQARTHIEAARKQTVFLFADCDAWLMPSAPGAAPKGFASTGDPVFNRLATALHLPAINVPVYRSKLRLPLGLQLIGAPHHDEKLLAVAARFLQLAKPLAEG